METNDNQLYALRKQAVRLHLKGLPVMQIVAMTGLSWPGVRSALDRYEAGGMAALKPAIRGKKPGTGRSLTGEQEQVIRRTICDKRPEQDGICAVEPRGGRTTDRAGIRHQAACPVSRQFGPD